MQRLFGKAKDKPPPPTLDDAVGNVRAACSAAAAARVCTCVRSRVCVLSAAQLDKRGGVLDERIKKLNEELKTHTDAMRRARPGPAQARSAWASKLRSAAHTPPDASRSPQEAAKQRALRVLKQRKMCVRGVRLRLRAARCAGARDATP
jgi:hypothetical protein